MNPDNSEESRPDRVRIPENKSYHKQGKWFVFKKSVLTCTIMYRNRTVPDKQL